LYDSHSFRARFRACQKSGRYKKRRSHRASLPSFFLIHHTNFTYVKASFKNPDNDYINITIVLDKNCHRIKSSDQKSFQPIVASNIITNNNHYTESLTTANTKITTQTHHGQFNSKLSKYPSSRTASHTRSNHTTWSKSNPTPAPLAAPACPTSSQAPHLLLP
jgi:hypothetical protein